MQRNLGSARLLQAAPVAPAEGTGPSGPFMPAGSAMPAAASRPRRPAAESDAPFTATVNPCHSWRRT